LLGRLSPNLDRVGSRVDSALALTDAELIDGLAGRAREDVRSEWEAFDHTAARARAKQADLKAVCRCDAGFPERLRALASAPHALHVAGSLERFLTLADSDCVAVVGARRASGYGLEVARSLGRDLARAGITLVSGMAFGIDSAAHSGALETDAATIAVLPAGAERAYPAAKRAVHRELVARAAVISELPPGTRARRWMFPARNRVIAGLASATVVVEGTERSGALLTARFARQLARPVGAVPGRVTSAVAAGPNGLLSAGAAVVRNAQDILDMLFGAGTREAPLQRGPELPPELQGIWTAISDGHDTLGLLERVGFAPQESLAAIAALELVGLIKRTEGGRLVATT
jgi:DNA processing protein